MQNQYCISSHQQNLYDMYKNKNENCQVRFSKYFKLATCSVSSPKCENHVFYETKSVKIKYTERE